MDFKALSIDGILSLFKYGLLQPVDILKADYAISLKVFENQRVAPEDLPIYSVFNVIVQRIRNQTQQITPNPTTHYNTDLQREAILNFDLDLLGPQLVQEAPQEYLNKPPTQPTTKVAENRQIILPKRSKQFINQQQRDAILNFDLDLLGSQSNVINTVSETIASTSSVNMPSTSSTSQSRQQRFNPRDVIKDFTYLTIESESARLIKKFNIMGRNVTFRFKPVADTANPLTWLEAAFEELREYAVQNAPASDRVGLVLRNHNFPEKPLAVSFRRVDQLSTKTILAVIEKILQSNASFFSQESMTLQVDQVTLPVGYGRMSLTGVSFETYCDRKIGILVVPNKNNLCLAAAIVLGIAFKSESPEFHLMKLGLPILNERANELCVACDVNLDAGGNYEDIQKFQQYLTTYTIVVYNCRLGRTTYFEGPREKKRIAINLIMDANHYNVITSLTSAFTTSYYCELCKLRFNNKKNHRRCVYICPACQTMPPCMSLIDTINCQTCNRDFYGRECFDNHKRSGVCQKIYRCLTCLFSVWLEKKEVHKCGFKYCNTCHKEKSIRHLCYMSKNVKKAKSKTSNVFIFYDFECRQEKPVSGKINSFFHEPNLCVAAHVCEDCMENEDVNQNCKICGKRLNIFRENPVTSFLSYVSHLGEKFKVTALAHNMKGYDGCFVLQEIIKNSDRWNPKLISTGTKIISITCGNIRFIDSLNFIPLPLAALPKTFNFPEVKGYFPYLFNTLANKEYAGALPDIQFYAPNQMSTSKRADLLQWHSDQTANGFVFNMSHELVKYCVLDVQILLKACLRFWKPFLQQNSVDPFLEATTIASACNLVFRRLFLEDDVIGLIPPGGYRLADKQSIIAIKWLLWLEYSLAISIQHAGRAREFRLPEGLLVDGYCKENNTVFEFLGCYWHGCEICYPNQTSDFETNKKDAFFLRRELTEARAQRIKSYGYKLISIWECSFTNLLKINNEAREYTNNDDVLNHKPLDPRDGFFGGRTNAVKLYYKPQNSDEKICYYDVCSLYPYVNKYGKYPVGHPKIHIGHKACSRLPIATTEGLIKCLVLPPSDLYHPVLPCKLHNKLLFILCRSCAESLNQELCTHTEQERSFVGTYVADELRKALSLNYKILEIYEIWEYKTVQYNKITKSGGLFAGYVNNFLKMKAECSGWPVSCVTAEDKANYIQEYLSREGIELNIENIRKNPGMRYIAKLMLTSFWGKFGQRENLMQSSVINNPHDFFKLLTDPSVEVNSLTPIDDNVIITHWARPEEDVKPLTTVSVAIAAYTTAQARLELYNYLEKLDRRVLYFDTDSVIFTHKEGEWKPETGEFLGQMTDEVAEYGVGSYISEFVSSGPKSYSFKVYSTEQKCELQICKVKGITLNFENSKKVNFEQMKAMVCDNEVGKTEVYVSTDRKIVRNAKYEVISRPESKAYRINYNKRRRVDDSFDTLPYGFLE